MMGTELIAEAVADRGSDSNFSLPVQTQMVFDSQFLFASFAPLRFS
jgi:hypothetical protein